MKWAILALSRVWICPFGDTQRQEKFLFPKARWFICSYWGNCDGEAGAEPGSLLSLVFPVYAEESMRETVLTPTLWIGWACTTQLTQWHLWLQESYKSLYRSRKSFFPLSFVVTWLSWWTFVAQIVFVGIENAPVGFSNPSWETSWGNQLIYTFSTFFPPFLVKKRAGLLPRPV